MYSGSGQSSSQEPTLLSNDFPLKDFLPLCFDKYYSSSYNQHSTIIMSYINILSGSWVVYNIISNSSTKYLHDSRFLNLPASPIFSKSLWVKITYEPTDFLSDELSKDLEELIPCL